MLRQIFLVCVRLGTATLLTTAAAAEPASPLSCPSAIAPAGLQPLVAAGDWRAFIPSRLPLTSAGFMAGPPELTADLKPYSVLEHAAHTVETWKFDENEFSDHDGLWLVCLYGATGAITLSKKIDSHFHECSVTYMKSKASVTSSIQIHCQ
ncbi:STY0301 family protein [Rugamonas sp.]|uniref:STY0301 family protein n=1 Tax=Rugamonas sp. TaxID=1926287 RepID=UPI0025EE00C1|nr:STY0301 family protein [Rugamonas sp.]